MKIWTRRTPEERLAEEQINLQRESNASTMMQDNIPLPDQDKRSELLRWQQELDDQIIILKHEYRNEDWDEIKGKWVKKTGIDGKPIPPLMNEHGIQSTISMARPLLNRNLINSNMQDEFVRELLRNTCNDFTSSLAINGRRWGAARNDYDTILRIFKNYIIPTPFRAVNGWNKKTDSTNFKHMEAHTETGRKEQRNSGFIGILRGG